MPGPPTDPSPAEQVRAYLHAFAAGDPETIAAHVSPDFVNEHVAVLGEGCVGRDAYQARLRAFLDDMVGLRYEIERLVVQGDHAMAAYRLRARWRGESPVELRGVMHLVVRNGLITRRTDYWDSAGFLVQVDPAARATLAAFGVR